jgi:mannose-1-phosphate guanylyltransferase
MAPTASYGSFDAVLGDDSVVGADCEIAAGTRIWVGVTLPDRSVRTSDEDAG